MDLELERGRVHVVLANCGDAVATDIQVEFSRPLRGLDDASVISELPLFKRLGVLRPGAIIRAFWAPLPSLLHAEHAKPFVATATWTERTGERRRAEYRHDPSVFRGLPQCD